MVERILLFVLFFLFFYDIKISEPFLTVRFFMGLIGSIVFIIEMLKNKVSVKRRYISILVVYVLLLIWNFVTCYINNSSEFQYMYELKFLIIIFFASYFLVKISRRFITSVSQLFDVIILMALVQCAIAVLASVSDGIHQFVMANANAIEQFLEREQGTRLIGVGSAVFFGVLPTSSLAILSSIYQYFFSDRRNKVFYVISFVFIFFITFLMARTIVFVSIPAVMLYFIYSKEKVDKSNKVLLILLPIVLLLLYRYASSFMSAEMYEWAFNSFSRNSENTTVREIYEWYAFTHFDTKTLLIGDARMTDGEDYYMGIDAGYIRAVFNVGIIGLFLYFYFQYYIVKTIYKATRNKELWFFVIGYFIFYYFIMFKGYTSISKELLFLLVMIDYGRLSFKSKG